jgi:hydroxyacylglutathione hydrolase
MPEPKEAPVGGGQVHAGATDSIQFVDEPIAVEYGGARFGPRSLTWRSRVYPVEQVLREWQDFQTPAYAGHARGWLHRRHRNYYLVRTTSGEVLELYLDRAGGQRTWVLVKRHRLSLRMLTVGKWGTNCYLLESNGECMVVDPGDEPERILTAVTGQMVVAIVLTHGHRDHVRGVAKIQQETSAPLYVHEADAAAFGLAGDRELTHGQTLRVGWFGVQVFHTPGHTPGGVCLGVDERALVGDSLFPGGPGRTDSSLALDELVTSLHNVVFAWPDETRFYPGHGEGSTIGAVRPAFRAFEGRARPAGLCGDVDWAGPEQSG